MVQSEVLDFTNVREGNTFRRTRFAEGDYKGRVIAVVDAESSKSGKKMWVFTIEVKVGRKMGTYPYYCVLDADQLWKTRNLFAAAGVVIPKKRFKTDPNKLVGKLVGVTLENDEYKDKIQSTINSVMPVADVADADDPEIDDDEDDEEEDGAPARPAAKHSRKPEPEDDEDEEDEPEPPKKTAKRKPVPAPVVEDEDDEEEDEEDEEEPPPPPARTAKKKTPPPVEEDDEDEEDEDDEEPPAPVKKATAKKAAAVKKTRKITEVDDDELEELDIDNL